MDALRDGPSPLGNENRTSVTEVRLGKSREPPFKPSRRWVSRMTLSTLCILSIAAFVQPSSDTTVSISWRSGSMHSGLSRMRYKIFVNVYIYLQLVSG